VTRVQPTAERVGHSEQQRLDAARVAAVPWKLWGPYLSERQWGTVREDYSRDGNAWDYLSHDQSRSRAYRWGEDGLAGISDDHQRLCFALALWNGRDPILKERLFGLTNLEGNHGEDVKECYYYLDSTPTHSYMKYLYRYPQAEFPYRDLVETNRGRSREEPEYELIDTGIFDDDRYFDVFVEYGKAEHDDLLISVSVHNRGDQAALLHLLPTLWFRNTWAWGPAVATARPSLRQLHAGAVLASHPELGELTLYCEGCEALLFTENDTNSMRLWGRSSATPYVKDAFHDHVVAGKSDAVNPDHTGTKAAAHYRLRVGADAAHTVRLRLTARHTNTPFAAFDATLAQRRAEADDFYTQITPQNLSDDERRVFRQALAGMLWSKQYYYFDVDRWLVEHDGHPKKNDGRREVRNAGWFHMLNRDVISMPDKWEYPWYAAWDLAFHAAALSVVDLDFAKQQLLLMLGARYAHPNGQLPAYEWSFSDLNPPVHAWATLLIYYSGARSGRPDVRFLERSFQGLLPNFNWWLNREDPQGRYVFAGGFLGLDNIGVFDRNAALPTSGHLDQADGTAWMALYSQNMLEIAMILLEHNPLYEDVAFRLLEHFLWIASAMDGAGSGHVGLWDREDGFFYDVLRLPDGESMHLKVRSMVGLLPLCASTVLEPGSLLVRHPRLREMIEVFRERYPLLLSRIAPADESFIGYRGRMLLSVCNKEKLQRILRYLLDESEFLSPHGIRSLSRRHLERPFVFGFAGQEYRVQYLPAESNTGMFGGNSNWRGPVWLPVNGLLIRGLLNLYQFFGDEFRVECPTGSGNRLTLFEVARELTRRLSSLFLRDSNGERPVFGGARKFQDDPLWRDHILFYEYFHGDTGAGLGASHQTGWTGIIAPLLALFARYAGAEFLESSKVELGRRSAGV
jgi:hypothetical protein